MLLPTLWLHDYCDPGLDVKALEERLTMTGTYVERLYAHGVTRSRTSSSAACCRPSSIPTPTA